MKQLDWLELDTVISTASFLTIAAPTSRWDPGAESMGQSVPFKRNPKRVVIVDDSRTMQALLEQMLSMRLGFDIVGIAGDGASAVSMVEHLEPDLVTIDLNMPYIDGQELLLKLSEYSSMHKVVISSHACSNLTVKSALERLGADACLDKNDISKDPVEFCKALLGVVNKPKAVFNQSITRSVDKGPASTKGVSGLLRSIRGFPVPSDEQRRLQALSMLNLTNVEPNKRLDMLTEHLVKTTSFSACTMTFIDRHTQWIKSGYNFERGSSPRAQALCSYTICNDEPLIVNDAKLDRRFSEMEPVKSGPMIRAYVGCPIVGASGTRLGSLCLIDTKPKQITAAELANIKGIAKIAAEMIDSDILSDRHAA